MMHSICAARGSNHHIHVARRGADAKFLGGAFKLASRDELKKSCCHPGASPIVPISEPGGGERVTRTTPHGHTLWLEHGVARL